MNEVISYPNKSFFLAQILMILSLGEQTSQSEHLDQFEDFAESSSMRQREDRLWVGEQSWTVNGGVGGSVYSSLWTWARLKCVLRGTSWPWLELPRPTEVAHSWRSCEGGLFLLLNGCFCIRGVCASGPFPFPPPPLHVISFLLCSHWSLMLN